MSKRTYRLLRILVAYGHLAVVFSNTISFIVLPIWALWPPDPIRILTVCPIMTTMIFIMFQPARACPVTRWENKLRKLGGEPQLHSFLTHYLWRESLRNTEYLIEETLSPKPQEQ